MKTYDDFRRANESGVEPSSQFRKGDIVHYIPSDEVGVFFGHFGFGEHPSGYPVLIVPSEPTGGEFGFKRGTCPWSIGYQTWCGLDNIEPVDDWLRRKVGEDRGFATTEVFRKCASRELRAEHPEAGADFGFFDTKRVDESIYNPNDMVVARVNGRLYFGTIVDVIDANVYRFQTKVSIDNPKDTWERVFGVSGREIVEKTTIGKYIRKRVSEDPNFITSEFFRKYASPGLKAKYPEAGTDFGFFDAKRVDENATEFHIGDRVFLVKHLPFVSVTGLKDSLVGTVDSFRPNRNQIKVWWERLGSDSLLKYKSEELVRVDDYVRRKVEGDPGFAATPEFARYANPELKAKYPEAGTDFGFFDTKANESSMNKERVWHVPPHDVGDRVVVRTRGNTYLARIAARCGPTGCEVGMLKNLDDPADDRIHFYEYFADVDVTSLDDYVRRKVERDSGFAASPLFRELASPELRAKYPEAGADFGFFDTKKEKEG